MSRKRAKNSETPCTTGPAESTTLQTLTLQDLQHIEIFSKHRGIYDFYRRTGEVVNFHAHFQSELLAAYLHLFDPYYHYDQSCPICVAEFLTRSYLQYDKRYTRDI